MCRVVRVVSDILWMGFQSCTPALLVDPWIPRYITDCPQITAQTRSNNVPCPPGGSSGMMIMGYVLGDLDGHDNDAATDERMGENEKKRKRAALTSLYTVRYDGMHYQVPMHSSLGKAYRKLVTAEEKLKFMKKHGEAHRYRRRCPHKPGPEPKEKKTPEFQNGRHLCHCARRPLNQMGRNASDFDKILQ